MEGQDLQVVAASRSKEAVVAATIRYEGTQKSNHREAKKI